MLNLLELYLYLTIPIGKPCLTMSHMVALRTRRYDGVRRSFGYHLPCVCEFGVLQTETLAANAQHPQFCVEKCYVKSRCLRHSRQFTTGVYRGITRAARTSVGGVRVRVPSSRGGTTSFVEGHEQPAEACDTVKLCKGVCSYVPSGHGASVEKHQQVHSRKQGSRSTRAKERSTTCRGQRSL
jgi:hypothetical protein